PGKSVAGPAEGYRPAALRPHRGNVVRVRVTRLEQWRDSPATSLPCGHLLGTERCQTNGIKHLEVNESSLRTQRLSRSPPPKYPRAASISPSVGRFDE